MTWDEWGRGHGITGHREARTENVFSHQVQNVLPLLPSHTLLPSHIPPPPSTPDGCTCKPFWTRREGRRVGRREGGRHKGGMKEGERKGKLQGMQYLKREDVKTEWLYARERRKSKKKVKEEKITREKKFCYGNWTKNDGDRKINSLNIHFKGRWYKD